jgi:hypothetical protein
MNHLKTTLKWVLPSIKAVYNLLAVNAEVFCRHSFGRRYAPTLLASFFFCFVIMAVLQAARRKGSSTVIHFYLFTYFVLVLYHLVRMWHPRRNVHSRSSGQSWEFWRRFNAPPTVIKSLFEPAALVVTGVLIYPVNVLLAGWIQAAGVCLFAKELLDNWKHRNRVLDASDARLEGDRISTGIRQYSTTQSGGEQGVSPVAAVQQPQLPANSIQQIYSRLDPALQQLVAAPLQTYPNPLTPNRRVNRPVVARNQARPVGARLLITPHRNRT